MAEPKVLIVSGNGFNCEQETSYAFALCGGKPDIIHMNDIVSGKISITDYQILAFVGGFSYGDHLGSGKITANKFRYYLSEALGTFIQHDTLIIGICNGFQVLTQMGILPGFDGDYTKHLFTLAPNTSARYEDRWVKLTVNPETHCIFTRNIQSLYLSVRHGEGKIYTPDFTVLERLFVTNQAVIQYCDPITHEVTDEYPYNPNGSLEALAGFCDVTGRIFGMMPHPEAYLSPYNHPYWTRLKIEGKLPSEGDGVAIFRNAVEYFQ